MIYDITSLCVLDFHYVHICFNSKAIVKLGQVSKSLCTGQNLITLVRVSTFGANHTSDWQAFKPKEEDTYNNCIEMSKALQQARII